MTERGRCGLCPLNAPNQQAPPSRAWEGGLRSDDLATDDTAGSFLKGLGLLAPANLLLAPTRPETKHPAHRRPDSQPGPEC